MTTRLQPKQQHEDTQQERGMILATVWSGEQTTFGGFVGRRALPLLVFANGHDTPLAE
jgi:hypothetical protein